MPQGFRYYRKDMVISMKKKLLVYSLIGAPIGIAISTVITVIISFFIGNGEFYAVSPELIADCSSEINAVAVQAACSLVLGAVCGASSVIWDNERLSLLLQTILHFAVISVSVFLVSFFMYWMPHSVLGILSYFVIFVAVYIGIWCTQYFNIRAKIKKMNDRLKENI